MRPPKYPLEPLLRVREGKVENAKRELAESILAREEAAARRTAAERDRTAHEAAADAERQGEGAALERGELKAADLMRADAWESRVHTEDEALARREDDARRREAVAQQGERDAQQGVALRKAEAQVVQRSRARWSERGRNAAEAREEETASEGWRRR